MNKLTTDITATTGINISKYDILPAKVYINDIEITDTESWNKAISKIDEKDKEIERLKTREQECIDKYLAESKYRGEREGKYVLAKYVIDELEKFLNDYVKIFKDNDTFRDRLLFTYAILGKIKELKGE